MRRQFPRRGALVGLMLMSSAFAQAPVRTAPITLQGDGPYYRLALPLALHGLAASSDLRDLRVRNAAGLAVPYAWLHDEAAEPLVASQRVPIFALPAHAAAADPSLDFSLQADGSLRLKARPGKAGQDGSSDWLIDASQIKGRLLQARFELAPAVQGVFGFQLEASDDLRQWRPVSAEEQLLRLNQGGQTLERLAVDLGHLQARFLRLRWNDPLQAAALAGVTLDSVEDLEPVAPVEWSSTIKPERCEADFCDYRLPRGLPAQSLRIELADINTLARISVSGLGDAAAASSSAGRPLIRHHNPLYALRHHRLRPAPAQARSATNETLLLDTVVYRLKREGGPGEVRSPPLPLEGAVYERLRLRSAGPMAALGSAPPVIAVGSAPRMLVFLAQGAAPFSLAWDAAAVPATAASTSAGAALSLATLLPGQAAGRSVKAGDATVLLPTAVPVAAASVPTPGIPKEAPRRWPLGAALALGIGLLVAMALPLFRNLRKENDGPSGEP